MTDPRDELARLAAATRGALEWHQETGEGAADVAGNYEMPDFGTAPEGSEGPGTPPPVPSEAHGSAADAPTMARAPVEPMISEAARAALDAAVNAPSAISGPPPNTPPPAQSPPMSPASPDAQSPAVVMSAPASTGHGGAADQAHGLQILRDEIGDCTRCPLHAGRTELVYGVGAPGARLMMIADGPGPGEDETGLPFVDEAGLLLGRMIRAMGLRRSDVYLTYLVKCRSQGIHPEAGLEACSDFLARQVSLVQPEVIIALGDLAARRVTGREEAFPRLRGQWFEYRGVPIIPTFHPVALLQNPRSKALVWSDLQSVMRRMGLKQPRRN